ncbi:outer membrane beta-barrel protein [Sandarakinorhabdus sp. AAP62]|uniref:outer membrane protein n=1 Tax=Sandarakinorhabdus sp. AAP62 TaxID=1248916 RepID=UPI0002D900AF|nr:outer membrane beta-barrel protein [Sandarakinorhabdus sp. AAP62]
MTLNLTNRPMLGTSLLVAIAALLSAAPGTCAEKFNGFYVGGDFGYESSGRTNKDGWTFGGLAGFNLKATDRIVVGGEVRLADSTIKEQLRRETATDVTVADTNIGRSIGLAARLGYIVGERTMVFGRVGWEDTRLNAVSTRTPKPPTTNPNPVVTDFSFNDDTLTLGAGVEHFVTDTVSLRLGYDWAENFDRHQVRLGVAFNF